MNKVPREQQFDGSSNTNEVDRRVGRGYRAVTRVVTLVLAVGFAVVGVAGAASAHHNTISGSVTCATGGGWAVTWKVTNSESQKSEKITASNRSVVPVGTELGRSETKTFTETITTKPSSDVKLELTGYWQDGNVTRTNSGSIPVASFSDGCKVTTVRPPTVPVVDECGPGNAHFGAVPTGPWTSVLNPGGSLTITPNRGYSFGNGQASITYPAPTDTNQPCPVVTPPVVTPPVVVPPPEVLPAQVRLVKAKAKRIDKCGRASDLFKVVKRSGVVYKVKGKVVRQGVWIKAKKRAVTVRAHATDATVQLQGKRVWKMTFTRKACARAPQISPNTGS